MSNTAVYTVGRFNPMHLGHEALINRVGSIAKQEKADAWVFPTPSHDPKKNPLKFEQKIYFLKKAFPKVNFNTNKKYNNPFSALDYLATKYEHIILVVGSDRVPEMQNKLEPYFAKTYQKDNETIEVVQSGLRGDIKVGGVDISGTSMRNFVKADDYDNFVKGVPSSMPKPEIPKLFNAVKAGMQL